LRFGECFRQVAIRLQEDLLTDVFCVMVVAEAVVEERVDVLEILLVKLGESAIDRGLVNRLCRVDWLFGVLRFCAGFLAVRRSVCRP